MNYSIEGCCASEQATPEKPCWGRLHVFDVDAIPGDDGERSWEDTIEYSACDGHVDGMSFVGCPCDLDRYRPPSIP